MGAELIEASGLLGNGTGLVGAAVAVIIAAALWLKRLKPTFAVDEKLAAAASADTGIIQRLEAESKRLAEQNTVLADLVNKMQLQVMNLMTENGKLHIEVSALREENQELRKEIKELTETLNEMQSPKCATCMQMGR